MTTSLFKSSIDIAAADTYILKTGQTDSGMPSVRSLDFDFSTGSFVGTVTMKSRPRRSSAPLRECNYEADYLNGAVSDGQFHADVITANSSIRIDDTTKEIAFTVTRVSGTLTVTNRSESDA